MIGLIGYNFCADGNALDPTPTDVNNITYTRVQNGIFDHFNVSRDTSFDYSSIIPTDWDTNTLMNADFAGNTSAVSVVNGLPSGIFFAILSPRKAYFSTYFKCLCYSFKHLCSPCFHIFALL